VSTAWRELTTESVTQFQGFERVGQWLNDDVLKRFVSLESLLDERSAFKADYWVSEAGFVGLTNLKRLMLGQHVELTDAGLSRLISLTELDIIASNIRDSGVSSLTNLTSLSPNGRITNLGVKSLTKLRNLNLNQNVEIDGDGLQHLTNLTRLNLANDPRESLDPLLETALRRMPNLIHLSLPDTMRVSSEGLSGLTGLTALNLSDNGAISNEGIVGLINLKYLDIESHYNITDAGISGLTNLTALYLCDNHVITNRSVRLLTNLTALALRVNPGISDEGIMLLTKLTMLSITFEPMDGYVLSITNRGVAGLTNLTDLHLNNIQITDHALTLLTKLDLEESCNITGEGLIGLPKLRTLLLSLHRPCNINSTGLMKLTQLTKLNLGMTWQVTQRTVSGLTNLTYLAASLDKHSVVPKVLKLLPNLCYLRNYSFGEYLYMPWNANT
jgi:internalin A